VQREIRVQFEELCDDIEDVCSMELAAEAALLFRHMEECGRLGMKLGTVVGMASDNCVLLCPKR